MASSNQKEGDEHDDGGNGNTAPSGWSSWIQMAKNKSLSALDLIKKDLAEFTQVVTKDTSKLVSGSTALVKDAFAKSSGDEPSNSSGRGIQQIISSLTKSYAPYDDADEQPLRVNHGAFETFDRYKARLQGIQTNPATFCTDPDDMSDHIRWLETFDIDFMKSRIAELLVESAPVRALYTKLVPSAMSHHVFWQRYFYRVRLLDIDEARKADLKQRADKLQSEKEQQLAWPDEKDDWDREDEFSSSPCQQTMACDTAKVESKVTDSPTPTAVEAARLAAVEGQHGLSFTAVTAAARAAADAATEREPVAFSDVKPAAAAAASATGASVTYIVDHASASSACNSAPFAGHAELVTIDTSALPLIRSPDRVLLPAPCASLSPTSNESDASPELAGRSPGPASADVSASSTQQVAAELHAAANAALSLTVDVAAPAAATAAAASDDGSPADATPSGVDVPMLVACGVLAAASHEASVGKESPAEMVDVLPDANVDSDWEKEFDVGDEEVASPVVNSATEKTNTDGDLDWETWE